MKAFLQFLQRAYKYFRNTKRVWRRPPRASLLIIDRGTASPLDEMFAHHNPHIMEIRGESVNMFALLRALPKIHLGAVAYLEAYATEDAMEGDHADWHHRSAEQYRRHFRRAGLQAVGMHCYVGRALAGRTAALECGRP